MLRIVKMQKLFLFFLRGRGMWEVSCQALQEVWLSVTKPHSASTNIMWLI